MKPGVVHVTVKGGGRKDANCRVKNNKKTVAHDLFAYNGPMIRFDIPLETKYLSPKALKEIINIDR